MRYSDLVLDLMETTGHDEDTVKDILLALPGALLQLPENELVRTPLGVFRLIRRKGREVRIPTTMEPAFVKEEMVVKLKPGSRLRFPPPD